MDYFAKQLDQVFMESGDLVPGKFYNLHPSDESFEEWPILGRYEPNIIGEFVGKDAGDKYWFKVNNDDVYLDRDEVGSPPCLVDLPYHVLRACRDAIRRYRIPDVVRNNYYRFVDSNNRAILRTIVSMLVKQGFISVVDKDPRDHDDDLLKATGWGLLALRDRSLLDNITEVSDRICKL